MNANFVKNQRIIRPTTHHTSPANGIWTDTQRSQICKLQILLGSLDAREHLRTDVGGGSDTANKTLYSWSRVIPRNWAQGDEGRLPHTPLPANVRFPHVSAASDPERTCTQRKSISQ